MENVNPVVFVVMGLTILVMAVVHGLKTKIGFNLFDQIPKQWRPVVPIAVAAILAAVASAITGQSLEDFAPLLLSGPLASYFRDFKAGFTKAAVADAAKVSEAANTTKIAIAHNKLLEDIEAGLTKTISALRSDVIASQAGLEKEINLLNDLFTRLQGSQDTLLAYVGSDNAKKKKPKKDDKQS